MKKKKPVCGVFVTGTGTDVGKTYVCKCIAQHMPVPVSYVKSVQTGCVQKPKKALNAPDPDAMRSCSSLIWGEPAIHAPYCFPDACSPHLAAKRAKQVISFDKIKSSVNNASQLPGMENGCVIIEGAGGVLVPLSATKNMLHLIADLDFPVILVATVGLGTLNHTFLSLCALQSVDVQLAGIVVTSVDKTTPKYIADDNIQMIKTIIGKTPFCSLAYGEKTSAQLRKFCNDIAKRYL
jgi:dethiobiotin synthase